MWDMTKAECELLILHKTEEIFKIYREYNPDGNYLTMYVLNGHVSCSNNYQEADSEHPISAWYAPEEEDQWMSSYHSDGKLTFVDYQTGEVVKECP